MKFDKESLHLLAVYRPRMGLETMFRCLLHLLPDKLLAEIFFTDDSGLVDSGRGLLGANLGASGRHWASNFRVEPRSRLPRHLPSETLHLIAKKNYLSAQQFWGRICESTKDYQ